MASKNLTLPEYQKLIAQLVKERGFDEETVAEVFTVFIEEVGEFAKTIRKANGQKTNTDAGQLDLKEEAADVFFMLIDLCNRLDIDLSQAFEAKEAKNKKRKWA